MEYNLSKPYDEKVLNQLHQLHLEMIQDFEKVCEKYKLPFFAIYGTAIGAVRHQGFIPWDDDVDLGMLRSDYNKFLKIADKEMGDKYRIMTPLQDEAYACTVTHLQRKGTKFVPAFSKDLTCDMCINLDIFPFDTVAPSKGGRFIQKYTTLFWGKLLFLKGTGYPVIPGGGWKKAIAEKICVLIHMTLKLLRIKTSWIYGQFLKNAVRYNSRGGKYVTSFEYGGCMKDKIVRKEIFPVKKVSFENITIPIPNNNHEFLTKVYGDYMEIPPKEKQINHCPYLIQFEGERPIIEGEYQ